MVYKNMFLFLFDQVAFDHISYMEEINILTFGVCTTGCDSTVAGTGCLCWLTCRGQGVFPFLVTVPTNFAGGGVQLDGPGVA